MESDILSIAEREGLPCFEYTDIFPFFFIISLYYFSDTFLTLII